MADPQVASCNQVWPSASNPPPSTLLKHVTQGQLKAFKGKSSPRASPLRVGFPHSRTHQLDRRQPSHPLKRPTGEASKLGHSKPLFNLWHKTNTSPFPFRLEWLTTSPWVEPISWQRPRQRVIDPQAPRLGYTDVAREITKLRGEKDLLE